MAFYRGYGRLNCPECGSESVKLRELDDGAWCKDCGYEDVELSVWQGKKGLGSNFGIAKKGF